MNLAVVGSRDLPERAYWQVRFEIQTIGHGCGWDDMALVSGGARGADSMAERAARDFGIPIIVHKADWKRWGKSAGHRRNALIVADADRLLAFYFRTKTPGTAGSVALARAKGIPVHEVTIT